MSQTPPKPTEFRLDGQQLPRWLEFPDYVLAPSPFDKTRITRFKLDPEFALTSAKARRRTPAFELWCQVIGEPPRVPNVSRQELGTAEAGLIGLKQAHACFLGVRRPIGEDKTGSSVLSYVTRPNFSFEYQPDLVTIAKKIVLPPDLVFITNVKLVSAYNGGELIPEGIITHWGCCEMDTSGGMLPLDHERRFDRRLW